MKFKWDKKYLYWGVTALLVIVASSCFFIGLYNFRTIAGAVGFVFYVIRPVVYGLIFAYLMNPIMNFIEKRVIRKVLEKRGKKTKTGRWIRVAGLSVTVLIVLLILAALIYMIVPQIIASVKKIIDSLPMYFDNLREWSDRLLEDHPDMAQSVDQAFTTLYQYLQNWFSNDFIARIDQYISSITTSLWVEVGHMFPDSRINHFRVETHGSDVERIPVLQPFRIGFHQRDSRINGLTKNPQNVLTRQVLLEKLWDADGNFVDEHALTAAISRVRNKIETEGRQYIKTVYGMGYMWIGGALK